KVYYWLAGEAIEEGEEEGTDALCVAHNMISLTPISFNMTDFGMIDRLKQWAEFAKILEIKDQSAVVKNDQPSAKKEAK
ncbi:MAG TPA: hypothetical protein V6D22_11530, partial [Candidatus Obscuribacterales bacterium]